jgi:hypothetical protein
MRYKRVNALLNKLTRRAIAGRNSWFRRREAQLCEEKVNTTFNGHGMLQCGVSIRSYTRKWDTITR